MAKLSTLFVEAINEGLKAAKLIQAPEQKATAYAALAQAMAQTGLISSGDGADTVPDTTPAAASTPAPAATGKGSLKAGIKPKVTTPPAEKAAAPIEKAAPVVAPVVEPELADEWNDVTLAAKASELEMMTQCREYYGDEALLGALSDFSEGVLTTFEDITPLNIDGFLEYLKGLAAQE
jgi:hypothetical protein